MPFLKETKTLPLKKNQGSLLEKKIASFFKKTVLLLKQRYVSSFIERGSRGYLGHLIGGALIISFVVVSVISIVGNFNYIYDIPYVFVMAGLIIYLILGFLENRFKQKIMTQLPIAIEIVLRGIKAGSSVEKNVCGGGKKKLMRL